MSKGSSLGCAITCVVFAIIFYLLAVGMSGGDTTNYNYQGGGCIAGICLLIGIPFFIIFLIKAVGTSTSVHVQPPLPETTSQQAGQKQQATGKAKSDSPTLARETILGEKLPATGRYVTVKDRERQSGMYILGVQGVGKSSLLENIIYQDIRKGFAIIVIDPHGDLIQQVIAQMPEERLKDTYVLSLEDTGYPFGVNLFSITDKATDIEQAQALDRILHVFEKCFPETSRMLLEKYLGNIAPVFFAHASTGYAMTDIPKFLRDEAFRAKLLKNVRFFIRQFWEDEYVTLSPSVQRSETASLATR